MNELTEPPQLASCLLGAHLTFVTEPQPALSRNKLLDRLTLSKEPNGGSDRLSILASAGAHKWGPITRSLWGSVGQ